MQGTIGNVPLTNDISDDFSASGITFILEIESRPEFSAKMSRELRRLDAQKFNGSNWTTYCYAQHAVDGFHILERKEKK